MPLFDGHDSPKLFLFFSRTMAFYPNDIESRTDVSALTITAIPEKLNPSSSRRCLREGRHKLASGVENFGIHFRRSIHKSDELGTARPNPERIRIVADCTVK